MTSPHHIFVAGLHRSGTSLMHDILRRHPAVSGFRGTGVPEDEGQHLQTVVPPALDFGGPGRFGFDPGSHMDESHPLATDENSRRLRAEWSRHWDLSKRHLVEKSPPNLVRTRFLQRMFPGCSFVIILRHPVAVALATRKWNRLSVSHLLDHTLTCYERFAADRPFLDRKFVFRYEDLVADPVTVLTSLGTWLGLESPLPAGDVRDENVRYLAAWAGEPELRESVVRDGRLAEFDARMRLWGYRADPPFTLPDITTPACRLELQGLDQRVDRWPSRSGAS